MARILIVEDEGILAMKTEMDLLKMGHEVIDTVETGQKALDIALKLKPEIVLMDIILQGSLDGISTAKKICESYDCKVIYMTAHADAKTIEEAKETRHIGFLHKPFDQHQLNLWIEKALAA